MNTERSVSIECAKCGEIHPHCTAHNRAGKPCRREPSDYQDVCTMHGAKSPQALEAAARRQAAAVVAAYEPDSEAIIAAQGLEPLQDPLEALGRVAAASEHLLHSLGSRVNALPDIITVDKKGTEEISAIFRAYERAMERHAKFADLLVRAGYDERRLKINEQMAAMFGAAMRAVLDRLDLTPGQREVVGGIIVEELTRIEQAGG